MLQLGNLRVLSHLMTSGTLVLSAPSDVFSYVGVTVMGEICVQNITAEDGLNLRQGGNACNCLKLKV